MSESLRTKFLKEYWFWNKNQQWYSVYKDVQGLVEAINSKFAPNEYMIEDCRCLGYSFNILNRKEQFLSKSDEMPVIFVDFRADGVYFLEDCDDDAKILSKYTFEQREEIYREIVDYVAGFQLQY